MMSGRQRGQARPVSVLFRKSHVPRIGLEVVLGAPFDLSAPLFGAGCPLDD